MDNPSKKLELSHPQFFKNNLQRIDILLNKYQPKNNNIKKVTFLINDDTPTPTQPKITPQASNTLTTPTHKSPINNHHITPTLPKISTKNKSNQKNIKIRHLKNLSESKIQVKTQNDQSRNTNQLKLLPLRPKITQKNRNILNNALLANKNNQILSLRRTGNITQSPPLQNKLSENFSQNTVLKKNQQTFSHQIRHSSRTKYSRDQIRKAKTQNSIPYTQRATSIGKKRISVNDEDNNLFISKTSLFSSYSNKKTSYLQNKKYCKFI